MRLEACNGLAGCIHGGTRLPGPVLACLSFRLPLVPNQRPADLVPGLPPIRRRWRRAVGVAGELGRGAGQSLLAELKAGVVLDGADDSASCLQDIGPDHL